VIAFPLDHELLYVDDHRLNVGQGTSDARMDGLAIDMLESVGFHRDDGTLLQLDAWGPGDVDAQNQVLKLSQLANYKYVVWSTLGTGGFNGNNALVSANACDTSRILQAYLKAGGSLWIYGQAIFGCFRNSAAVGDCQATNTYRDGPPASGLDFSAGSFPCDFLHICAGNFETVRDNPARNGLIQAAPTAGARGEGFPSVEMDSTLYPFYASQKGIPFVDVMLQPTFDTEGILDTLYTLSVTPQPSSSFRGKPCAFRAFDPNPVSGHGPVAIFGFPLHFLKQGTVEVVDGKLQGSGVKGVAASLFDWFRAQRRGMP
jgi:hypothetical protein